MHFIQNSWFATNWIFLLLFLIGTLAVIAYINNKTKLFKYSVSCFSLLFLFILCFFLLPEINNSLSLHKDILPQLGVGDSSEENISAFAKIIEFISQIVKDKLFD